MLGYYFDYHYRRLSMYCWRLRFGLRLFIISKLKFRYRFKFGLKLKLRLRFKLNLDHNLNLNLNFNFNFNLNLNLNFNFNLNPTLVQNALSSPLVAFKYYLSNALKIHEEDSKEINIKLYL